MNQFKAALGSGRGHVIPDAVHEATRQLATLGPEQGDRPGTPLFFREDFQRPQAPGGKCLQSQQVLVAGMLRPEHLLDLVRNFILFQQVGGRTRKVVARYQQFRAVHRACERLQEGRGRVHHARGEGFAG